MNVREVVHISKASWTRGPMKAKIRRQNVLEVIKPGDKVFLGHKIPSCEMSANLREEIVTRAKKCAAKPSIVFDYHYRYHKRPSHFRLMNCFRTNCESFCNMILFDIPGSTQAPYTIRCLRGFFQTFLCYQKMIRLGYCPKFPSQKYQFPNSIQKLKICHPLLQASSNAWEVFFAAAKRTSLLRSSW